MKVGITSTVSKEIRTISNANIKALILELNCLIRVDLKSREILLLSLVLRSTLYSALHTAAIESRYVHHPCPPKEAVTKGKVYYNKEAAQGQQVRNAIPMCEIDA
jgi:hypothetical protein